MLKQEKPDRIPDEHPISQNNGAAGNLIELTQKNVLERHPSGQLGAHKNQSITVCHP